MLASVFLLFYLLTRLCLLIMMSKNLYHFIYPSLKYIQNLLVENKGVEPLTSRMQI